MGPFTTPAASEQHPSRSSKQQQSQLPSLATPGLRLAPLSKYSPGPGTHVYEDFITASVAGSVAVESNASLLLPSTTVTSSPANPLGTPTQIRSPPSATPQSSQINQKPTITVSRAALPSPVAAVRPPSARIATTNILPSVGSVVLARVLRVRSRQIDVGILCVGIPTPSKHVATSNEITATPSGKDDAVDMVMHVCADAYPAVIRREDVRAAEKDKVVCAEGFRVDDVVRGKVISVGDSANYYLTTAGNELGVVMARSEQTGRLMVPISWREMGVPVATGGSAGHGGVEAVEERKVAKPF